MNISQTPKNSPSYPITHQHRRMSSLETKNTDERLQTFFHTPKLKQYVRQNSHKKLTLTSNHKKHFQYSIYQKQLQKGNQNKRQTNKCSNLIIRQTNKNTVAEKHNLLLNPQIEYYHLIKIQLEKRLKEYISKFSAQIQNQKDQIEKLKIKLKQSEEKLQKNILKTNKYNNEINNNHQYQYFIVKVRDLEIKANILNQAYQQQKTQINLINGKINILQSKSISFFGGKVKNLTKEFHNFFLLNEKLLVKTEDKVKDLGNLYLRNFFTLSHLINQAKTKIQMIQQTVTKESFSNWTNFEQFSFNRDSRYKASESSDTFFYPNQIRQNFRLQSIIQTLKCKKTPIDCYLDSAGYLRYSDLGTYIFDKNGNFIGVDEQEVCQLSRRNLIKISKFRKC